MPTPTALAPRPLRLWPGVLAAVLLLLTRFGIPVVLPDQTIYGVIGGFAGAVAIVVWWLFFSRAAWSERIGAIALMVAGLAATWPFVDVSISTGAMGGLLLMLAVPPLSVALVAWAVVTHGLSSGFRRTTLAVTMLLASGVWTLAKTGGFTSDFKNDLMWRWAQTPEDRLVADPAAALPIAPTTLAVPATAETGADPTVSAATAGSAGLAMNEGVDGSTSRSTGWTGFRGPRRDGIVRGVQIETDWAAHPPVEMWRRPIGPGWSSFSVQGDQIYTQEQRGEDEIVTSYSLSSGKPVWTHRDTVRFWESNGGAGPRATPTLNRGRVYTFGATGILNALDARTGALVWSHDVAADTRTEVPMWGFSSSPLVIEDSINTVITGASGTLAAYELTTGKLRWIGPNHSVSSNGSYSSPQRLTIDGVDQIVFFSEAGATGLGTADGKVLWEYPLSGSSVLQPVLTPDGDLLVHKMALDGGIGLSRVAVKRSSGGASTGAAPWTLAERWTSDGLKAMFNDFVVHKGHAYGFDGSILACIDLADGKRKWKGGRYGSGELVLLEDQDVLLVLSEEGEIALVSATPDKFTQIAKVPAIEGKTWNHPVVVGDILLVRNGEEMAAFRLALASR